MSSSSPIIVIILILIMIVVMIHACIYIYAGIPKERQLNMLKKLIDTLVQEHHTGRLLPLPQVNYSTWNDTCMAPAKSLLERLKTCAGLPFHMSRFKGVVFRSIGPAEKGAFKMVGLSTPSMLFLGDFCLFSGGTHK